MNYAIIVHLMSNDVNTFYVKKVVNCIHTLYTAFFMPLSGGQKSASDGIFRGSGEFVENFSERG